MDYQRLRNHLVICGWKHDMQDILNGILRANPGLHSDQLVLVSNVDPQLVDQLKESSRLNGLKFVKGDYFAEPVLQRANIGGSAKVMVLADTLESSAVSEVDSKTVMTVLTCKAMSRETYVIAEILDRKFESYLRHAQCDEIVFSQDFSRQLIASTSSTNGMSHIVYDLISQRQSDAVLKTLPVPERLIGQSYARLCADITAAASADNKSIMILGLLQNTGTQTRMKIEALKEAQKTSDISRLVANIQGVKGLEANKPMLLPADDTVVPRYSAAIVLERSNPVREGA